MFLGFSKTPMIILNNADIDSACAVAVDGIWGYQGNVLKLPSFSENE